VQSSDDLTTVAALGVDQAQGYHVGRPDVGAATWATWSHRRWMRHSAPDAIELFHSV
jgi:EAL domain-containing protein (putative c-di-GMP-specific phosphodiesterase class I)